ncbi:MAG: hypothetical protein V3S98_10295 [Dehalococcoidia bacterium]
MANPLFDKLKEAFASDPERWVETFGFRIGGRSPGILRTDHPGCREGERQDFCTWWVDTGNFECKRCGTKSTDITDSYRLLKQIDGEHAATRAAEELAKEMGVKFNKFDPNKKGQKFLDHLPAVMDEAILKRAGERLLSAEGAACRKFITTKWKVSPEDVVALGVGMWKDGKNGEVLIYGTFAETTGKVSPRFKKQVPDLTKKTIRLWNKPSPGAAQPPRLWPKVAPGDMNEEFLIVEGESDLITARCRLKWQETGVYPVAIFGKGTIPLDVDFPECMAGKKVTLLMDLDAFQGPIHDIVGDDKAKARVKEHTLGKLWDLARYFRRRNCDVHMACVDMDAVTHPKGDLKDWVDDGGRGTTSALRSWSYSAIYEELEKVKVVETIDEALNCSPYQRISIIGTVATLEEDTINFPLETTISCSFGDESMEKTCDKCGVPKNLGPVASQPIPWARFPEQFARMLYAAEGDDVIVRDVCQKARSCPFLAISHPKRLRATRWEMVDAEATDDNVKLRVVSPGKAPPIVGRVRVTGHIHSLGKNRVGLVAERMDPLDSNVVDIDAVRADLLLKFPHATDDIKLLTEKVVAIATNFAEHVTDIKNRVDLHIGGLITLCSALWYLNRDGRKTRGWIDTSIMGLPREGKSGTIKRMFEALGMGYHTQASSSGSSAAGFTASSADMKSVKPGTWPKHHGRAVALDEMQNFFGKKKQILEALQSARSDGVIDSDKCTGSKRFDAAVRAFYISNFPRKKGRYPCTSLIDLCDGHIQAIARLDFPLFVNNKVKFEKAGVPDVFKLDLVRTLVQRAWSQEISEIGITTDAFDYADAQCDKWAAIYDQEELPLFSGQEKTESVIRIAIAVANLTFSHDGADPSLRTVEVRRVHVEWACQWLEYCWAEAEYDKHSEAVARRNRVNNVMQVQALLTKNLEAHMVEGQLMCLLYEQDMREAASICPGNDWREQNQSLAVLRRCNVLEVYREAGISKIGPTRGGVALITRIIDLANDNEDTYDKARTQWEQWKGTDLGTATPPDFSDADDYHLFIQNEGQW